MQVKRVKHALWFGGLLVILSLPAFGSAKIKIDDVRWLSIGAGLRTDFSSVEDAAPDGSRSNDFTLENARLYLAGQATHDFKFYFGTDRTFGKYSVIDAIIQYEPMPEFNVWMGRHLTPADRIEMNGPFYALSWNQYTVPLFPSDNDPNGDAGIFGRDDGITVWGAFAKFQYSFGVFNGVQNNANQSDALLYATRLAYNFLNKEANPGYYTSSTYFGKGGDILTLALVAQYQDDGYGTTLDKASFTGYAADFLFEKSLGGGSAITAEGEYKSFRVSSFTPTAGSSAGFSQFDGESYFATVGFLVGSKIGIGKLQPYLRYTRNSPTVGASSDLSEIGLNYIISGHNLRLNLNYTSGDANLSGNKGVDNNALLFGIQFQI